MRLFPTRETSLYIKDIVEKVYKKNKSKNVVPKSNNPHISLGGYFFCNDKNFFNETSEWIKEQKPFIFNINRIDNFKNGLIYLTSTNPDEIKKLKKIFYGIKTIGEIRQNREISINDFVPHLSLVKTFKSSKTQQIRNDF